MCSKDEISNSLTCLSQRLKCYGTCLVEFDLRWYLWLDSPFFVSVLMSLFMWSERVSCLLWAQSEASWECLRLMRLTYCLMTENYSDDSRLKWLKSLPQRLRNYIVGFEALSLRSGWSEGSSLLFSSAESFNSCLLCHSWKWGFQQ